MKINIEKLFLFIFVVILSIYSAYFINSNPDIYVHYLIAGDIFRDPSFLWRTNLSGWQYMLSAQSNVFISYPPLVYFFYVFLMALGLPLFLVTIFSMVIIGYTLYKINWLAIPFLFLSFIFIRETAFNGYDIVMMTTVLLAFYFLIKKKLILSGILVGMTALMKVTGFFAIFAWMISMIIFYRDKIKTKHFILAFMFAILIPFPWYFRNYLITHDIYLSLIGATKEQVIATTANLATSFQMNQPERFLWDSSRYYPLPIDLLFYVGIIFFIINLIRTKKIEVWSSFVIIMVIVYFALQLSGNPFFIIRHEMLIFPFLALEIVKGIPSKYLKYSLVVCIIFLLIWSLNLSKYSFNQYSEIITPACNQIKSAIDYEPVYVNAFHNWFVIYKCNLNATIRNESKWTLDFDQGKLYATNITNTTGV